MPNEPQKCQRCANPATHHVIKIINGKVYQYVLCADHAQAISATLKNSMSAPQVNLVSLLQQFIQQQQSGEAEGEGGQEPKIVCPNCRLAYRQYRKTLLLGCSDCYQAFEAHLVKDLRKFHGAIRQSEADEPEMPKAEPVTADDWKKMYQKTARLEVPKEEQAGAISLLQLKKQLADAVRREDFEQAADLRDQVRDMEAKPAESAKNSDE